MIAARDEAIGAYVADAMRALCTRRPTLHDGVWYPFEYRDELVRTGASGALPWSDDHLLGHAAPAFFDRLGSCDWKLRRGVSASRAIRAWLDGLTLADCGAVVMAIVTDAVRQVLGDVRFDARFADRLRVRESYIESSVEPFLVETEAAIANEPGVLGRRPVRPGELAYFVNHPRYLHKHPTREFRALNVVCTGTEGTQTWGALGLPACDEVALLELMVADYNCDRDAEDLEFLAALEREHELEPGHTLGEGEGETPPTITREELVKAGGGYVCYVGNRVSAEKIAALR